MGLLSAVLRNPDEFLPLMRLKKEADEAEKKTPEQPHWAFCYSILTRVSRSFSICIKQFGSDELRDAICVFYVILRALDTIEDDTNIPDDVKVPNLISFYLCISDNNWHFPCGTKHCKDLMDNFHNVRKAFLELDKGYQEIIVDIAKIMGAGMAKYISTEVKTMDDYNEYCYYVAGVIATGLPKCFNKAGVRKLPQESVGISCGLFLQKTNIIQDYLEDINEQPKPRMFWPRVIWSKYADNLEDFKKKEYLPKALQCMNELITDALLHVKDCLICVSCVDDPIVFKPVVITQVMAIGTLTLCYNNPEVFRGVVKIRHGLVAKIFYETKTASDVYNAFFEFSSIIKSKIDMNDPNAERTVKIVEDIQNYCKESGKLDQRKFYISRRKPLRYNPIVVIFIVLALAFLLQSSLFRQNN